MKRIPVLLALLIIIMACQSDEPARPAENNDTTEDPSDQNDPGDQNQEPPAFELTQNTISLASTGMTNEDIVRTFYDVSGTFIYEVGGEIYGFYPGVADWSLGSSIEEISPVESIILKKEGDQWAYFQKDPNARFWGARNFEAGENYVVIGDGNEIGPNFSEWRGDAYYGAFQGSGNIQWTRINADQERGFFHGTCSGDINGDGLIDVGLTPGIDHAGINLFVQNSDGSFDRQDQLLPPVEPSPFTLDFADVDNDGIDEIITADYGGGGVPDADDHEIRVYKLNSDTGIFDQIFQANEPNAYTIGMGATSIKTEDFNNDGFLDIAVAREDLGGNGFEVWKGNGDGTFVFQFSSPTWSQNEMQFREFSVFDANLDGHLDILLRPFHYGNLYRVAENCWWNVYACNGIKLNHLIWLNNGDATFNHYSDKDLIVEDILVDTIQPYMDGENLHFVGTFYEDTPFMINVMDLKINF